MRLFTIVTIWGGERAEKTNDINRIHGHKRFIL